MTFSEAGIVSLAGTIVGLVGREVSGRVLKIFGRDMETDTVGSHSVLFWKDTMRTSIAEGVAEENQKTVIPLLAAQQRVLEDIAESSKNIEKGVAVLCAFAQSRNHE